MEVILIGLVILLLLTVAGFLVWYFIFREEDKPVKTVVSTPPVSTTPSAPTPAPSVEGKKCIGSKLADGSEIKAGDKIIESSTQKKLVCSNTDMWMGIIAQEKWVDPDPKPTPVTRVSTVQPANANF